MNALFLAATRQLQDAAIGLRVVFGASLIAVIFAGLYIIKKRRELFGRDPHVTADTWASRNLRLAGDFGLDSGDGSFDHDVGASVVNHLLFATKETGHPERTRGTSRSFSMFL